MADKVDLSVEAQSAREDVANALQIITSVHGWHDGEGVVPGLYFDVEADDLIAMRRLLRSALKKLEAQP